LWISQTEFLVDVDGDQIIHTGMPFHLWYNREKMYKDETALRASYNSHEGTLWWEVRPRVAYGTIEVRPCCQSKYAVNVDALILGLIENGKAALEFARTNRSFPQWRDLSRASLKDGLRASGMQTIIGQAIWIAQQGLKQRGFGEEQLLDALMLPIETLSSPGHHKLHIYENGGLASLVEHLLLKST
jgi:gamma-glutamylcysteine synthetase